jgi:hypothetical protein
VIGTLWPCGEIWTRLNPLELLRPLALSRSGL